MKKTTSTAWISLLVFFALVPFRQNMTAIRLEDSNLKGVSYVRVQCTFNGIPYYTGFKGLDTEKEEDVNAERIESLYKDQRIPITRKNFHTLYKLLESTLKSEKFRVLEIRVRPGQDLADSSAASGAGSTIIPTVSLDIEVFPFFNGHEMYVGVISVTVAKWMSSWAGTQNIQTNMIAWWHKNVISVGPDELSNAVAKAAGVLIEDFIAQWKAANTEEPDESIDS